MLSSSKITPKLIAPNLPRFVLKLANVVLFLGLVFSLFVSAYAVYKIFNPIFSIYTGGGLISFLLGEDEKFAGVRTFYLVSIFAGIVSAIFFTLSLRLNNNLRVNLALVILTTGITVYSIEIYLEFSQQLPEPGTIHSLADKRTKLEVISDLRKEGIDTYPNIHPYYFLENASTRDGLLTSNGKIFPLGGISNKTVIGSNETGSWMSYLSDRHGFHNPDDVYDQGKVDILLTGDSFTEGYAVRSDENLAAVLNNFGFNVINLGRGANGPLLEYATLREYAKTIKPTIVLWVYFENDVGDLAIELKSTLLVRYLGDNTFSQGLMERQGEINKALNHYVETQLVNRIKAEQLQQDNKTEEVKARANEDQLRMNRRKEFVSKPLIKVLKLRNLRKLMNLAPDSFIEQTLPSSLTSTFRKTILSANHLVSSWHGRLYFVYLPGTGYETLWRKFILHTINELAIPIIDIQKEIFSVHHDPLSLYPFRNPYNHYNAKGYRLVGETIAKRLNRDDAFK